MELPTIVEAWSPADEVYSSLDTTSFMSDLMAANDYGTASSWLMNSNCTVSSADYDPNGAYCYIGTSPRPRMDSETSANTTSSNCNTDSEGRAVTSSTSTIEASPPSSMPTFYIGQSDPYLQTVIKVEPDFKPDLTLLVKPDIDMDDTVFDAAGDYFQDDQDEEKMDEDGDEDYKPETETRVKRKYQKRGAKKVKNEDQDDSNEVPADSKKKRKPKRAQTNKNVKKTKREDAHKGPTSKNPRAKREYVPDEEKDEAYWAHRKKNTSAAQRSRAKKRCLLSKEDTFEELLEVRGMNEKSKCGMRQIRSEFGKMLFEVMEAARNANEKKEEEKK